MSATEYGTLRDEEHDRRGVRFERLYDSTPAELWRALTDPAQIAGWLAHASRWQLEPGGEYRLEFGDGDDAVTTGVVRRVEEEKVLELSWSYPGELDSLVRFEIVPQEQGVKLVLDHSRLPAEPAVGYAAGWQAHLDALGRLLAGEPAGDAAAWLERYEKLRPEYEERAAALP